VAINNCRRYFSYTRAGYFDAEAVRQWRERFRGLQAGSSHRTSVGMGLVGVRATQQRHHKYLDGSLCELPSAAASSVHAPRGAGAHILPAAASPAS
jgi:asparagine synthase (glutamine-hydrolysing)